MDFSSVPPARQLHVHRVAPNPNPVGGLRVQTPQERMRDVQQAIIIWRGRQIQHQQSGAGG